MKPPLVLYHAGCWDGFCAAWVFHCVHQDAECIATNAGLVKIDEHYDLCDRDVYLLDLCYREDVLRHILSLAKSLTIVDHHITAIDQFSKLLNGYDNGSTVHTNGKLKVVFDINKSGARLTYDHYGNQDDINLWPQWSKHDGLPWLIAYTEDRDLWRHKLPDSKAVNARLRMLPLQFDTWNFIHECYGSWHVWDEFVTAGKIVIDYEKRLIDQHVYHAREIMMDGYKILAVNATILQSEIAGALAKNRPFGACYFDNDCNKRVWSLRSDGVVDVAIIASKYGGGGHTKAAGFTQKIDGQSIGMAD